MIESYKTLSTATEWTKITIKKSRFYGHLSPISSLQEMNMILDTTTHLYKNPTHIVYAYRLFVDGQIQEYCTDAGEPANSSGPPILRVLRGAELVNICAIVVRLFGGIKLGIGGLVKAYTESTQEALSYAHVIEKIAYTTIVLNTNYHFLGKILHTIEKVNGSVIKLNHGESVQVVAKIPLKHLPLFKERFSYEMQKLD